MKIYKTLSPIKLGVVVTVADGVVEAVVHYMSEDPVTNPTMIDPITNPTVIDPAEKTFSPRESYPIALSKDLVESWVSHRGLVECTHIYVIIDKQGKLVDVRNKTVDTLADKKTGSSYLQNRYVKEEYCLCQIYIPLPDSPFEDWVFRFNADPEIAAEFPEGTEEIAGDNQTLHDMIYDIYPQPVVEAITDNGDGSHTFTVGATLSGQPLVKEGLRFFINADIGYVNKREVRCGADGKAHFKARRLDLDPSDKMTVEIGFKFIKNLTHAEVPL